MANEGCSRIHSIKRFLIDFQGTSTQLFNVKEKRSWCEYSSLSRSDIDFNTKYMLFMLLIHLTQQI